MGFLFKSAAGLGAVYFAMFAPALKSDDMAATASLCATAAKSRLADEAPLRAHWAAAGCVLAVSAQAQKALPAPPHGPPPHAKIAPGGLSEADLREPWFGPTGNARKSAKRG